ncbi:MAG TPA: pseudouridine synthase [Longimicrobiales bacterium]
MSTPMRLQKFLSRAGVASRRAAEAMIREGRVRVNGRIVTELGTRVDVGADRVSVDGRPVELAEPTWIALHKPRGYVSTRSDPQGRPTIYDLIPDRFAGLFHVGRLDVDSEGLLLLTNQGDTANRLLHPRHGVERVYDVIVRGVVGDAEIRRLLDGIGLEDGVARAAAVERRTAPRPGFDRLRVTMREGRKREVRRMFRALGHRVHRLIRLRYGPVRLAGLEPGAWRHLAPAEVRALEAVGRRRPR